MSPIEQVLAALNTSGVRYLIVGGVAVGRPQDLSDIEALTAIARKERT